MQLSNVDTLRTTLVSRGKEVIRRQLEIIPLFLLGEMALSSKLFEVNRRIRNEESRKEQLFHEDNRIAHMISRTEQLSLAARIVRASSAQGTEENIEREDQTPLEAFGFRISVLRRKKGLSLEQLAELAQMDADVLFAIEMGAASLDQVSAHLRSMSEALSVNYRKLSNLLMDFILGE